MARVAQADELNRQQEELRKLREDKQSLVRRLNQKASADSQFCRVKEELREQVWGATHVSDTRLRVTVREVRAALGDDQGSPEYLETVPGRGYRFVATNETSALDDARATLDVPLRGGPAPVVGRERELEHLVNRFLEASRGERRVIFLAGGSTRPALSANA